MLLIENISLQTTFQYIKIHFELILVNSTSFNNYNTKLLYLKVVLIQTTTVGPYVLVDILAIDVDILNNGISMFRVR